MLNFEEINKIYLVKGVTDLRKGIDGYASTIQDVYHLDPFDKTLFIFCNRTRDKLKCLYWDGSGFWLLYKRLEEGKFKWLKSQDGEALSITNQQLRWLLEGLSIDQKKAFKDSKPMYV